LAEAPQYFEVIYLPKYFQIFSYFISKNSKNVGSSPSNTRRAYVRYEEGPQAVQYYNAEMRKVLTSRNYCFLSPPKGNPLPEDIVVAPDVQHEGELRDSALSTSGDPQGVQLTGDAPQGVHPTSNNSVPQGVQPTDSDSLKGKRKREKETLDPAEEPRKTRGIRQDYRYLNDPYSYKEHEVNAAQAKAMLGGGDPKSLKEAMRTPEWPEWEHEIQIELNQLLETRTWLMVNRTNDAIPIANKWVFNRKFNKSGELQKYKARLVAKGCVQRPGYDYQETFSPVVRMETIRVILSIAALKDLKIQQMDVKGAYLNGTLQEEVYMHQPEGYEDGSSQVCLLKKTLYGLKQSGREWNRELDDKLQKHNFKRLKSNPCTYIRRDKDDLEVITVQVDDLLLFVTAETLMKRMKNNIHSEWEVTDLGEPAKIVGIEITRGERSITISQERYIENILEREGMRYANPVAMPLDPNIKLEPVADDVEGSRSNAYASLLGELQFLANATRPDIAHAVSKLASYTATHPYSMQARSNASCDILSGLLNS
jgi:hypothetical protein